MLFLLGTGYLCWQSTLLFTDNRVVGLLSSGGVVFIISFHATVSWVLRWRQKMGWGWIPNGSRTTPGKLHPPAVIHLPRRRGPPLLLLVIYLPLLSTDGVSMSPVFCVLDPVVFGDIPGAQFGAPCSSKWKISAQCLASQFGFGRVALLLSVGR